MNTMRLKNSGRLLGAALISGVAVVAAPMAVHAEEGKEVPKELQEAIKILETIPDMSGKTEEEIEAIVRSNQDIDKKIAEAEKKIIEGAGKLSKDVQKPLGEDEVPQAIGDTVKITVEVPAEKGEAVAQAIAQGLAGASYGGSGTMGAYGEGSATNAFDEVPFMSLNWVYGGFKGGDARMDGVTIGGLKMKPDGMSFKWENDLSAWGIANEDASQALACLFVQTGGGEWVGGKFDWISSSRKTRDFKNIYEGYNDWSLANVPNPCAAAFVVVSKDGKKRSNVIRGMWQR